MYIVRFFFYTLPSRIFLNDDINRARKKLEFQLALYKYCSSQVLGYSFYNLVGRWVAWALAHWASENKKWLAQQENLLVSDNWTALFSSPDYTIRTTKQSYAGFLWQAKIILFLVCRRWRWRWWYEHPCIPGTSWVSTGEERLFFRQFQRTMKDQQYKNNELAHTYWVWLDAHLQIF